MFKYILDYIRDHVHVEKSSSLLVPVSALGAGLKYSGETITDSFANGLVVFPCKHFQVEEAVAPVL